MLEAFQGRHHLLFSLLPGCTALQHFHAQPNTMMNQHQTPLAAGQHSRCFLQTPAAPAFQPRGQRFHFCTHFSCCAGDPFSCSLLSIGCTQELHEKKGEDMMWSRKASDALVYYGPHKEEDLIFEASCTCRQVRQSLHICVCRVSPCWPTSSCTFHS